MLATTTVNSHTGACLKTGLVLAVLLTLVLIVPWLIAPTESTMGDLQRVLYIHVPVAWASLVFFLVMAVCSAACMLTRDLWWDRRSAAACELGWMASGLTLVTGSIWASSAWGAAWTWEPRLTTALILWMIYGACLMARQACRGAWQTARVAAVLAWLGAADVPLVVMATRWFRGIHPISPEMEPIMRVALYINVGLIGAALTVLFLLRCRQWDEIEDGMIDPTQKEDWRPEHASDAGSMQRAYSNKVAK